jgi:hypothetical protein
MTKSPTPGQGGGVEERAYVSRALADLLGNIEAGLPASFPNYAEWEIALPAGHWRALLAALAPSPAVGWRLVPEEPTEEMWAATANSLNMRDVWRKMVSTAPSPPSQGVTAPSADDCLAARHHDLGRLMEACGVHNDGLASPAVLFARCLSAITARSPEGSEPASAAPPLTEARVAAAFEAWIHDTYRDPRVADHNPCWLRLCESASSYARRVAAGLFEYLPATPALTDGGEAVTASEHRNSTKPSPAPSTDLREEVANEILRNADSFDLNRVRSARRTADAIHALYTRTGRGE